MHFVWLTLVLLLLQLNEGSGSMLVVAVGVNTEYGKTMSLVMTEPASTPLQEHLEVLAASIGKVGFIVAVICFIVLLIRSVLELLLHLRRYAQAVIIIKGCVAAAAVKTLVH